MKRLNTFAPPAPLREEDFSLEALEAQRKLAAFFPARIQQFFLSKVRALLYFASPSINLWQLLSHTTDRRL
jgi:hypothetical protein